LWPSVRSMATSTGIWGVVNAKTPQGLSKLMSQGYFFDFWESQTTRPPTSHPHTLQTKMSHPKNGDFTLFFPVTHLIFDFQTTTTATSLTPHSTPASAPLPPFTTTTTPHSHSLLPDCCFLLLKVWISQDVQSDEYRIVRMWCGLTIIVLCLRRFALKNAQYN